MNIFAGILMASIILLIFWLGGLDAVRGVHQGFAVLIAVVVGMFTAVIYKDFI